MDLRFPTECPEPPSPEAALPEAKGSRAELSCSSCRCSRLLGAVLQRGGEGRSFPGSQMPAAELPHRPRGGGQASEPRGLRIRRSHADSICHGRETGTRNAAVSRERSSFLRAVPSNAAPRSLIPLCFPPSLLPEQGDSSRLVSRATEPRNTCPRSPPAGAGV